MTGTFEQVLVNDLSVGDTVLIENRLGTITMLDTYSLGSTASNWPCTRIFIQWGGYLTEPSSDGGGKGYARFPYEYVQRFRKQGV